MLKKVTLRRVTWRKEMAPISTTSLAVFKFGKETVWLNSILYAL